jgi:hypothetical protein
MMAMVAEEYPQAPVLYLKPVLPSLLTGLSSWLMSFELDSLAAKKRAIKVS